ncbi:uncharacterized protein RJT21DRAFT_51255 [Scheffersomyces amazonensis]|uniref:uncharacterized protein n=1 Tax=Scheffersomyces amazonensis TaxID=1078765 RepID=UPI00315DAD7C
MSPSIPTTQVRLPSISELTAHSPINDIPSQLSPRLRADSRILPTFSTSSFRYPLKGGAPSNYILGNGPGSSIQKLPSPTLPPPITPQSQLMAQAQPPKPHQHSSAGSSPNNHYQYYSYQSHQGVAAHQKPNVSPPAPQPPQHQGQPAPTYYPQQVYYHQANGPVPMNHQYAVPEIINKPTNKCHRCGTTETPEWRRGPKGVRTLCNACGLFHAKLVKRKGAALAAEEVLNNKVCKGKNGRRISIKKHMLNESLKNSGALKSSEYHPGVIPAGSTISHGQTGAPLSAPPAHGITALVPVSSLPLPPPISSHYLAAGPHYTATPLAHIASSNHYPTHLSMPLIRH